MRWKSVVSLLLLGLFCWASAFDAVSEGVSDSSDDDSDSEPEENTDIEDSSEEEDSEREKEQDKDGDQDADQLLISLKHYFDSPSPKLEYKVLPKYFQIDPKAITKVKYDGFPVHYKDPYDFLHDFGCHYYLPKKEISTGRALHHKLPVLAKCLMLRFGNPFDLKSKPMNIPEMSCAERCNRFFPNKRGKCLKLCDAQGNVPKEPKIPEVPKPTSDKEFELRQKCRDDFESKKIVGWRALRRCYDSAVDQSAGPPKEVATGLNSLSCGIMCSGKVGLELQQCIATCKKGKFLKKLEKKSMSHVYPDSDDPLLSTKKCLVQCHVNHGPEFWKHWDAGVSSHEDHTIRQTLHDLTLQDQEGESDSDESSAEEDADVDSSDSSDEEEDNDQGVLTQSEDWHSEPVKAKIRMYSCMYKCLKH